MITQEGQLPESVFYYDIEEPWSCCDLYPLVVGSVKVNFFSYRYRADKSTIFGMRGLWGLTINSGGGATLKYL